MYELVSGLSFLLRNYYIESIGTGLPLQWMIVVDYAFPATIYLFVKIFFNDWHATAKSFMFLIMYWGYSTTINMIKHGFFSFWTLPQIMFLCFIVWLPFRLKFGETIFYSEYN